MYEGGELGNLAQRPPGILSTRRAGPLEPLFVAKRLDRIDAHSTTRRHVAGDHTDQEKDRRDSHECEWVGRGDANQQTRHQARQDERGHQSDADPEQSDSHPLFQHEPQYVSLTRTERHPHADLTGSLTHRVGDHTVQSKGCQN